MFSEQRAGKYCLDRICHALIDKDQINKDIKMLQQNNSLRVYRLREQDILYPLHELG